MAACTSYVILLAICLALLQLPTTSGQQVPAEPTRVGVKTLQSDSGTCPLAGDRETAINELNQNVTNAISQSYCGGTYGWRRVTFINMSDTSYECPPGLVMTNYSKRACGQIATSAACSSTYFNVAGGQYSRVCGRVIAYQFGQTSGFFINPAQTIDGIYVEGVSLTHGVAGQREHIWSFATGLSDVYTGTNGNHFCPCALTLAAAPPSYVGQDYFCESGLKTAYPGEDLFYPNDPLWNGEGCVSGNTCCEFNNPPWFQKTLLNSTINPIELRICSHGPSTTEDTPIEVIELYVQ